jgi:FMN reductase
VSRVRVTALVGNPRPASRTLGVASAVAERIAAGFEEPDVRVIDLAVHTGRLFVPGEMAAELERVLASDVLVVASPTYKATYTGLLKVFLDLLLAGALRGAPTVPVMTGGAANHSLALDVHLRPLLLELGASCPTQGLYVLEAQLPELDGVVGAWWEAAGPALSAALAARRREVAYPGAATG